jgi:AbrB family looped-hinge helix DNA binding protein
MSLSTLTSKGQITIPKDVRELLQLHAGDKVEFIENDRHEIVLKPVTKRAADVSGILSKYKKEYPVSIEEMDQAIADQVQRENR